ncbi:hypothetical protein FHG87_011091 [Trinorchestia longiramus]|nr:hypothetical protein FHG87_011091 [Trinorchestia longiramus]
MVDTQEDEEGLLHPDSCSAPRSAEVIAISLGAEKSATEESSIRKEDVHRYWWHVFFATLGVTVGATALVVSLPVYLKAVNVAGTAYVAVLFVWSVVVLVVTLCLCIKYFSSLHLLWNNNLVRTVARYGVWHGVACVAAVYALDRKRVLCHLQEPLMALTVLYMMLLHCFYHGAVVSSGKLVCQCGVLAGLFLALDFQLNDEYLCRGVVRQSPATDGGTWTEEQHVLWAVVYAFALLLFSFVWVQLELLLMPDITADALLSRNVGVSSVCGELALYGGPTSSTRLQEAPRRASLPHTSSRSVLPHTSSGLVLSHPLNDSALPGTSAGPFPPGGGGSSCVPESNMNTSVSNTSLEQLLPSSQGRRQCCTGVFCDLPTCKSAAHVMPSCSAHAVGLTPSNLDLVLLWFLLSTCLSVVALFWTDLFTALGKSGSGGQFVNLTLGGLKCHFSSDLNSCGPTALYGWLCVLCLLLLLGCVRYLCLLVHSLIFPLSVASLALPFSCLFWALCSEGGPYGIIWTPKVTGELVFAGAGTPVMVASLVWWLRINFWEPCCCCSLGSALPSPASTNGSCRGFSGDSFPTAPSGGDMDVGEGSGMQQSVSRTKDEERHTVVDVHCP